MKKLLPVILLGMFSSGVMAQEEKVDLEMTQKSVKKA